MALIEWTEKYSVGIKEIDDQHKKLIELINKLYEAMRNGNGKIVLESILKELLDYTKYHFSNEEKLMAKYGYAELSKHKKEHDELTSKVEEINQKLIEGKMVITSNVLTFLKKWLNDHILVEDKQYTSFFNDKGVK